LRRRHLCQRIIQYLVPACKWLRLYFRLFFAASSVFFVENVAPAGAVRKYLTLAAIFIRASSQKILFLFKNVPMSSLYKTQGDLIRCRTGFDIKDTLEWLGLLHIHKAALNLKKS
jgi:hypothetical protein